MLEESYVRSLAVVYCWKEATSGLNQLLRRFGKVLHRIYRHPPELLRRSTEIHVPAAAILACSGAGMPAQLAGSDRYVIVLIDK
jgi:hypothetical protein